MITNEDRATARENAAVRVSEIPPFPMADADPANNITVSKESAQIWLARAFEDGVRHGRTATTQEG